MWGRATSTNMERSQTYFQVKNELQNKCIVWPQLCLKTYATKVYISILTCTCLQKHRQRSGRAQSKLHRRLREVSWGGARAGFLLPFSNFCFDIWIFYKKNVMFYRITLIHKLKGYKILYRWDFNLQMSKQKPYRDWLFDLSYLEREKESKYDKI